MAKISTEYQSLLQRDVGPSPARLSDFTPPEKKVAKKEEPKIQSQFKDEYIGPDDPREVKIRSLIR